MKKQTLLMTGLVATTLLATTPSLAEEITTTSPVDTITVPSETKPVVPTQPSTDTSTSQDGSSETPVTPDNPIDGSTSTSQDTKTLTPTDPSKDDDKSSDNTKTGQEEPAQPTETPQEDPKGDDDLPTPVEVPTVDGETTVIPDTSVPTNNPNITADTAQKAGASQVGTTSTVTGQIVRDVTPNQPVTLSTGATITDIRDGLVTLSTGAKVAPESVGVTQNSDGTYTAKTIQGDMVTLPHTGEKDNHALIALGLITFAMSLFVAFGDRLKAVLAKVKPNTH